MNGVEVFDSVVAKCLHHKLKAATYAHLFYSAVLCMGQKQVATADDIYTKYFEWETARLSVRPEDRQPCSAEIVEAYNCPCDYFKGILYYLPPGAVVSNLHIEIYKTLTKIVPDLWILISPEAGSLELTKITSYLFGDIIQKLQDTRFLLN
jgi:hypothetical protein